MVYLPEVFFPGTTGMQKKEYLLDTMSDTQQYFGLEMCWGAPAVLPCDFWTSSGKSAKKLAAERWKAAGFHMAMAVIARNHFNMLQTSPKKWGCTQQHLGAEKWCPIPLFHGFLMFSWRDGTFLHIFEMHQPDAAWKSWTRWCWGPQKLRPNDMALCTFQPLKPFLCAPWLREDAGGWSMFLPWSGVLHIYIYIYRCMVCPYMRTRTQFVMAVDLGLVA